jgi:UDP-N-acetylmuramate: L-alanyl-gamma-D-glutamyl-meso-diaminopimelate ligase
MSRTFHFIAIGGAIMHQLAIYLQQQGNSITGSDDVIFDPALSQLKVHHLLPDTFGWDAERIHADIDIIILGMHAKADNPELIRAKALGLTIYSFPEFIYHASKNKKRVVIAGSHGKTSITSMVMHILQCANVDFDYLVGARIEGFDTMVKVSEESQMIILEGDEYLSSAIDRRSKFLHYFPDIAVISGIAWDHINVFPTMESYLDTFREFISTSADSGILFYYKNDSYLPSLAAKGKAEAIGYDGYHAEEKEGTTYIQYKGNSYPVQVFGQHNMENLKAAVLICKQLQIPEKDCLKYLQSFGGSAKRLELVHSDSEKDCHIYRDFAHAPSKLKASLSALRSKYPTSQLIGVFELHTFSSLQPEFLEQYAGTMATADIAIAFLDAHALKIKGKSDIADVTLKTSFHREDIIVLRSASTLQETLLSSISGPVVIAFMSSGNFANINIPALYEQLIVNM